jgi:SOS-response transcriptional repressor LexA
MFLVVRKRNMGSVGGSIVVGRRENRLQGEGGQRRINPENTRPEPDEVQVVKAEIEGVRTGKVTSGKER